MKKTYEKTLYLSRDTEREASSSCITLRIGRPTRNDIGVWNGRIRLKGTKTIPSRAIGNIDIEAPALVGFGKCVKAVLQIKKAK